MRVMSKLIKEVLNDKASDYVVIENVQYQNNYNTYCQLSQMQGVIFNLLFERDIPFCLVQPTKWKSFNGIKGRKRVEQKANTIQMVKSKYGLDVTEDEADAIGIGYWAINNIDLN